MNAILPPVLGPLTETLLRIVVGLALLPHGLRAFFGCFPRSGSPILSLDALAVALARSGYRPGRFWALVTAAVEFIAGPLLVAGLFTRLAALPITVFLFLAAVEHGRRDGYFWNTLGFEYPFLWCVAALYFLAHGGGAWSLDRWLGL